MKITPAQLTINQLFSGKNEQFYIPAYQRRYAWTDKQLLELFEDINLLGKNDSHFLGTILFLASSHVADINMLELVDGQQRIISLSLLLKAIRDRFEELKIKDFENEIDGYLFSQGIDRKRKNKILLGDLDNPDYSKVLNLVDIKEVKNKNLLEARQCFKKHISNFNFDKLNEYYFKLVNNTIVIRLDTSNAKDAYKLFETINNRGLKLSSTDIIKNFILGHASEINESTLLNVKNFWKDLIVSLDGIRTDDFFRQYLAGILQTKVPFSKLTHKFKRYYLTRVKEAEILSEFHLVKFEEYERGEEATEEASTQEEALEQREKLKIEPKRKVINKVSIIDFSRSLKDTSIVYANINNRNFDNIKINHHLDNLQRIESFPSYTFILNLLQRNIEDSSKIAILKLIESFMLRWHICEKRTAELDAIFPGLVAVKDNNIVEAVKRFLSRKIPSDNEFKESFSKYNFKGREERAKYILEEIEYYLIKNKEEIEIKNEVHLEHVVPKHIKSKKAKKVYGDWVLYLGKDALIKLRGYVDRIGNYTLISQKLNIRASNNPFRAKKKEYKKSNIFLTKELAENYRAFRYKEIEKRSCYLAESAVKIWYL